MVRTGKIKGLGAGGVERSPGWPAKENGAEHETGEEAGMARSSSTWAPQGLPHSKGPGEEQVVAPTVCR